MGFAIYFEDLTKEAQEFLLEFYEIESPKEMNWDVLPVAHVESGN